MDGARSDNDQETVISAFDDLLCSVTTGNDGLGSSKREGQVLHQDLGRDQGLDLLDTLVIELVEGCNRWGDGAVEFFGMDRDRKGR